MKALKVKLELLDLRVNQVHQGRWVQQVLWVPEGWQGKEDELDHKVLQGLVVHMACLGSQGQQVLLV